jgi:type IX secretion system PorP/SprF family membrane protein
MKKLLFFILLSPMGGFPLFSQQIPLQNHYFLTPYIYNPSLAGSENHAIIYVNRRQQFGNSQAPSNTSFTFNTPVASSGGFGVSFFNTSWDTASQSLAYVSFARVIPVAEDQFIHFGISAGFGQDRAEYKSINGPGGIPGLQSAEERISYADAQIGVAYRWKSLQLGLALPSMFDHQRIDLENPTGDDFSELDFDPFRGVLISAGYMMEINDMLAVQPQFLYRVNKDSVNIWEAAAIAHINKKFWVGALYRQDYGAAGIVGLRIQDIASISYSMEFSGSKVHSPVDNNHEIQIGIRIGQTRPPVKKGFKIIKEKQEGNPKPRYYYQPKRTSRSG